MTGRATLAELCIAACAEAWRGDGAILASATGAVPRIGAGLARLTFEPELLTTDGSARLVAEPGGNGAIEGWMPFRRVFDLVWSGRRHVMMGAAQLDRHGNSNISCIGDWRRPTKQLLGVRGGPGNAINHACSYWIPSHTSEVFVERVDFVSGPGHDPSLWADGASSAFIEVRRIVTDLAVLDCQGPEGTLRVRSLHPGVSLEQVQKHTGFELAVANDLAESPSPDAEALRLIREVLDPAGRREAI